ncbi:hypothetical protein J3455_10310 [Pseudoalteromonas sp. NFXS39]|uniref:hypothetical protein n=1 Tax=Pseudoalteromonas sp. NFXS39 TaxID=2818437 RepID=UPI0032DEE609
MPEAAIRKAANNGRLVIVAFVRQWQSHAQKARAQGCPRSAATDVAWPCYNPLKIPATTTTDDNTKYGSQSL